MEVGAYNLQAYTVSIQAYTVSIQAYRVSIQAYTVSIQAYTGQKRTIISYKTITSNIIMSKTAIAENYRKKNKNLNCIPKLSPGLVPLKDFLQNRHIACRKMVY